MLSNKSRLMAAGLRTGVNISISGIIGPLGAGFYSLLILKTMYLDTPRINLLTYTDY